MKRAVIFGSAGQLGVELASVLAGREIEVICFARTAKGDHFAIDIADATAVEQALEQHRPSVVLNPAAYNQVDQAESDPMTAMQVNALAVRNMAVACRRIGAKLVHYSTDYVFDGELGRDYVETDPTHPIGAYAVSKLAGELYAQAYLDDALIIRTSAVYGPAGLHTNRGNFPELMLKLAAAGKPIKVVNDHIASPTYAPALAARTADLLDQSASGVFHIGGGTPISWYDWAALIFQAAGVTPDFEPTTSANYPTAARRPEYSALANNKMEALGLVPMPGLEVALKEYMTLRAPVA
ncbi:MAG: dTDP-4-dehydrorhamnose reductase [Acidobacteriota bacterium]